MERSKECTRRPESPRAPRPNEQQRQLPWRQRERECVRARLNIPPVVYWLVFITSSPPHHPSTLHHHPPTAMSAPAPVAAPAQPASAAAAAAPDSDDAPSLSHDGGSVSDSSEHLDDWSDASDDEEEAEIPARCLFCAEVLATPTAVRPQPASSPHDELELRRGRALHQSPA